VFLVVFSPCVTNSVNHWCIAAGPSFPCQKGPRLPVPGKVRRKQFRWGNKLPVSWEWIKNPWTKRIVQKNDETWRHCTFYQFLSYRTLHSSTLACIYMPLRPSHGKVLPWRAGCSVNILLYTSIPTRRKEGEGGVVGWYLPSYRVPVTKGVYISPRIRCKDWLWNHRLWHTVTIKGRSPHDENCMGFSGASTPPVSFKNEACISRVSFVKIRLSMSFRSKPSISSLRDDRNSDLKSCRASLHSRQVSAETSNCLYV
jgi:hypothetical protein